MPVAGKVLEVNKRLDSNPELINTDPYGEGWIIKVALDGPVDGLLSAEDYAGLVGY